MQHAVATRWATIGFGEKARLLVCGSLGGVAYLPPEQSGTMQHAAASRWAIVGSGDSAFECTKKVHGAVRSTPRPAQHDSRKLSKFIPENKTKSRFAINGSGDSTRECAKKVHGAARSSLLPVQ